MYTNIHVVSSIIAAGNDGGKFYPFLNIELFLEEIHWNTDHLSQDVWNSVQKMCV